jgi:hypothetical protein
LSIGERQLTAKKRHQKVVLTDKIDAYPRAEIHTTTATSKTTTICDTPSAIYI